MTALPRVLVVTSAHPPTDVRIFRKQVTSLRAYGYSVTLMAPFREGAGDEIEAVGADYVSLRGRASRVDRVRRLGEVARHLIRHRRDYDVWHFHDPELIVVCVFLRFTVARRVKVVYDVHENYSAALLSRDWLPTWLQRPVSVATKWIERVLAARVALIVAATPSIARQFHPTPRRDVVTVCNYPLAPRDDAPPTETIDPKEPGVLRCVFVGALTAIRGVREMVSAMAQLDGDRFELVMAGPFSPAEFEREICDTAPLNVRWLGVVPFGQVNSLLESADVGLVCYLPEPNHVEAMPTKLFEYLAAGLPAVASNFESWRQFVEDIDVGLQVDPTSPAAIAAAITELAEDESRRLEMGKRGKEMASETFVWEREAHTLSIAYERLLSEGRGAR